MVKQIPAELTHEQLFSECALNKSGWWLEVIIMLSSFLLYAEWIGFSVIVEQISFDYDLTMPAELPSKLCAKILYELVFFPGSILVYLEQ